MSCNKSRVFSCYVSGAGRFQELETLKKHANWVVGQQEVGDDGLEHLQLMFGFKNARHLTAVQSMFPSGANVQITRDTSAMYKYVTKEGTQLIVHGPVPTFRTKSCEKESVIREALQEDSYEAAMRYVETHNLMLYINNYQRLAFYFTSKFDVSDHGLYDMSTFNHRPVDVSKKVAVFVGKTGLGKTQFALAHFKNPLHIRDKEDYRRYSEQIDGIVMDDLAFTKWDPMTFLKLLDIENPVTQSVKYGSVRIRAGCPRIICVNNVDLLWPAGMHEDTKASCNRRMVVYNYHAPLFKPPVDLASVISPEVVAREECAPRNTFGCNNSDIYERIFVKCEM